MKKYGLLIAALLTTGLQAKEEALSVDRVVSQNLQLAFPNDDNIQPDISDFAVLNFVLMSNDNGERWSVITLKNQSSGRRTLSQKQLIALLADGSRIHPQAFNTSFAGDETLSLTINLGENKFPVLSLYTRNR